MRSKINLTKKSISDDAINNHVNQSLDAIYYIGDSGQTEGPFNQNDLLAKINTKTLVYRDGIDWTEAINVPELKAHFSKEKEITSASSVKTTYEEPSKVKSNKTLFIVLGASIVILSIIVAYFVSNKNSKNDTELGSMENSDTNATVQRDSSVSEIKAQENSNLETTSSENTGTWVVIVGSYKSKEEANAKLKKCENSGINVELLNTNDFEKLTKDYYFICAGNQLSSEAAKNIEKTLKQKGFEVYAKDAGLKTSENSKSDNVLEVSNVSASSSLKSGKKTNYYPGNVSDDQLKTWWSPVESEYLNSWIQIEFDGPKQVNSVEIHNGSHYPDYPNYGDLYLKNIRITKAKLVFSDGSEEMINLDEVDEIQTISIKTHLTNYIKLIPISFKNGSEWQDICVSHFKAIGH